MAIRSGARRRLAGGRAGRVMTAFVFVLLCNGLSSLLGATSVDARPAIDEIVKNVRVAAGNRPEQYSFRQDIDFRVFILRWRFHADVVRDGPDIDVTIHGAPGFISPSDISVSLLEVSEGLDDFTLRFVEETERDGERYYLVEGTSNLSHGARGGFIWINTHTWLVDEALLEYEWGNLTLQQTFQTINGYTLLKEQQASVDRLGGKLQVQYGGYSFGEH